jgi:hypothetical protein
MSTDEKNGAPARSVDDEMQLLERKAKVVRSRLLRAVDALDARRHHVENVGEHVKEVAIPTAIGAAGVAALFGASIVSFTIAARVRRRRSLSYRLSRAIQRLDLVKPPPFRQRLFEKLAMTVVGLAATELAKAAAKNLFDGRLPDGRLAVGTVLAAHHAKLAAGATSAAAVGGPGLSR